MNLHKSLKKCFSST